MQSWTTVVRNTLDDWDQGWHPRAGRVIRIAHQVSACRLWFFDAMNKVRVHTTCIHLFLIMYHHCFVVFGRCFMVCNDSGSFSLSFSLSRSLSLSLYHATPQKIKHSNKYSTLWWTKATMENHNFWWEGPPCPLYKYLKVAICNSYLSHYQARYSQVHLRQAAGRPAMSTRCFRSMRGFDVHTIFGDLWGHVRHVSWLFPWPWCTFHALWPAWATRDSGWTAKVIHSTGKQT